MAGILNIFVRASWVPSLASIGSEDSLNYEHEDKVNEAT